VLTHTRVTTILQNSSDLARNYLLKIPKISLDLVDNICIMIAEQEKTIRNRIMLNQNYDDVNALLNTLVGLGFVEPIDDPSFHVDFYDYADVVGIDVDDYLPSEYDHA